MRHQQLKIYAASAALTIETQKNAAETYATLGIEAARRIKGSKTYDWSTKLMIQVTERELPTLLAVLLGYQTCCQFKYHGVDKNKSYTLQSLRLGRLFTLSSAEHGKISVPVNPTDSFSLSCLAMNQLQRNHGGLSSDVLLTLLKQNFFEISDRQEIRST